MVKAKCELKAELKRRSCANCTGYDEYDTNPGLTACKHINYLLYEMGYDWREIEDVLPCAAENFGFLKYILEFPTRDEELDSLVDCDELPSVKDCEDIKSFISNILAL